MLERDIPEQKIMGSIPACYTFHIESRSPKYFGADTIDTENIQENGGKKNEMFRPISVRNQLTMPYGRKVLGNLKQCNNIRIKITYNELLFYLTMLTTAYSFCHVW